MRWFPSFACPRLGVCWSDLFYPFSSLGDGDGPRKSLAVVLAICVLVSVAGLIVYVASYTPAFTKNL